MHTILLSVEFQTFFFPYKVLNRFRLKIVLRDLTCFSYTGPANEVGCTPWENLLQLRVSQTGTYGPLMSHMLLQRDPGPKRQQRLYPYMSAVAMVELPLPRMVPLENQRWNACCNCHGSQFKGSVWLPLSRKMDWMVSPVLFHLLFRYLWKQLGWPALGGGGQKDVRQWPVTTAPRRAMLACQVLEKSPGHKEGKSVSLLLPLQVALRLVLSLRFGGTNMSLSQGDLQNHFKQLFVNPCVFVSRNICKSIPTN